MQPYAAVDPLTGQPLSDKSKLAAGLLQLLLGGLTGIAGVGRLYAGQTGLGVAQLILSVVGWITAICLGWLILPLIVPIASWLWVVIDGIIILAGRPVDGQGRLLRS
ncbi:MAG TPA: TM2 domain-containing protein [Micromonosporaceae bacterium]